MGGAKSQLRLLTRLLDTKTCCKADPGNGPLLCWTSGYSFGIMTVKQSLASLLSPTMLPWCSSSPSAHKYYQGSTMHCCTSQK